MDEITIIKEDEGKMGKLYLVEGIPGVGKTTRAKELKNELQSQGKNVVLYQEGDSHPADMAWQAYLSKEEYDAFIIKCRNVWKQINKPVNFAEIEELIKKQTRIENNRYLVAYTKIGFPFEEYWQTVGSVAGKELCDGRSSFEMFRDTHLQRWQKFADEADKTEKIYIFECAFLQNHIFELMGTYECDREFILEYMKNLINTVKKLCPEIIYIKTNDIKKVIDLAAEEREGPRGRWIDEIADWVCGRPYGKARNLSGAEGVYKFCQDRFDMDMYVIVRLGTPYTVVTRKV